MLFDIIKSRIEDPATIIDRYTPGGFPTGKEAAKKLKAIKNSSDFDDSLLTIENTEITKDYNFFVYQGKYLVNSNALASVASVTIKLGPIQHISIPIELLLPPRLEIFL